MLGHILKSVIGPILGPLIEKIPDPNERRRLETQVETQLLTALTSVVQGQIEVNKQEAQHASIFVAGWRPWIGWVCGVALAWEYLLHPMAVYAAFLAGVDLEGLPTLETEGLYPIVIGMLGLGVYRTYEKQIGVARQRVWDKSPDE